MAVSVFSMYYKKQVLVVKWCRWAWPSTFSVTADPGIHCVLGLIVSKAVWIQANVYAAWLIRGLGSIVKQQVNQLGKIYAQMTSQVWAAL